MIYFLQSNFWNVLFELLGKKADEQKYFFTILLFVGFISAAFFAYFFPIIKIVAIAFVLVYLIINIFMNYYYDSRIFIFQLFLISFLFLQLFLNQIRDFNADLAILIVMLLGTAFMKNIDETIKILKVVVIVNFFIMLYEVINFEYLIQIVEANKYEFGRMQGLFSYSKEAGYFLLIAFIYMRYFDISMFYKIIILLSSVLSGSRTAIVAIVFILLVDYIYNTHKGINIKFLFKQYMLFIITITSLWLLSVYYFTDQNEYMLHRILSSFDFESSSQVTRVTFWNEYFQSLNNYSILQWLVGNGTYLNNLIGNGSENAYLMVISQLGILGFFIFTLPFIFVIVLFLNKPFKYYPLLVLAIFLFVGRIGVGWADGILMWMLVYYVIYQNYTYCRR